MNFILNNPYWRFAVFVYLVNISFFTSLFQCFYFFLYQSRSSMIALLGFFSFLIILIPGLFSQKWRFFYLNILFNEISLKFILKLQGILEKAQKKIHNFALFFSSLCCIFLIPFNDDLFL